MAKYTNREMALSVLAAGREAPEEEGVLAVQLAQVYAILDLADAVREQKAASTEPPRTCHECGKTYFCSCHSEPPKVIVCRKCHTLRGFGTDSCMCGERSWYVASTEPPKRTADMVHPNDGSAPCEQCGQGTKPPRKKEKP